MTRSSRRPGRGYTSGGRHAAPFTRRQPTTKSESIGRSIGRMAREIAFVALAAVVLSFVLKTFVIQSFWIPSSSMEDTLAKSDRVIVTKLAPGIWDVHRGDIVVFKDPGGWTSSAQELPAEHGLSAWIKGAAQALGLAPASSEEFLIKRVIGMGGDRVACTGGGAPLTVNGVEIDEPYLKPGSDPSRAEFDVVVPEGAIWVMGDNRDNSADSRAHQEGELKGAVSLDDVVGVAKIRTWPLNRLGILRNPGSVFADVGVGAGAE
jgi:signal peptidase I